MPYKILTKNGIDNTNIDGARDQHFNAGMRDGIVKGALNEGIFSTASTNSVFLDACELRISGHRVVIDEPVYKTFENAPTTNTRYAYVAEIKVDDNSNVEFGLFVQSANTPLVKDNLFKTTKGKGTYQLEIGRFTLQTDGTITDLVRTADVITGGSGKGGAVTVGNVTTEKIDITLPAEVDIDQRFDEQAQKEYLDFKFHLPIDLTEVDNRTQQSATDAAEAKRLAQEANDTSKTALSTADGAMDIADEANSKSDTAVNTANDANTKAENAETIAGQANTKSEQAVETANNADKTATEAKSVAEQADLTADSALTVAGAAADTANAAEETANQANTTSQEAKKQADDAVSTATSANKTASVANDKSDTAILTANDAKVTAEGIDAKATEALTNSETAVNTANEAKTIAQGAAEKSGTKVNVNGEFQIEWDADTKADKKDLQNLEEKTAALQKTVETKYVKPADGIPKTDLSQDVQSSINKADSAVQPDTLGALAKKSKISLTDIESGAIDDSKISDSANISQSKINGLVAALTEQSSNISTAQNTANTATSLKRHDIFVNKSGLVRFIATVFSTTSTTYNAARFWTWLKDNGFTMAFIDDSSTGIGSSAMPTKMFPISGGRGDRHESVWGILANSNVTSGTAANAFVIGKNDTDTGTEIEGYTFANGNFHDAVTSVY